jgi:hypothetical protein
MQRYEHFLDWSGGQMNTDPEGEWVKWDDHQARIADLEASLKLQDDILARIDNGTLIAEHSRYKNCLEYIATECDYEENVPSKRWLQQVAADALNPEVDHHDGNP